MSGVGADGAYMLRYKIKSGYKSVIFGYYTNGAVVEKMIRTNIQPDTVLFKSEF